MPYYRNWDIVVVPSLLTDQKTNKVRPAVIVSTDILLQRNGKYIVTMITSAKNAAQYGDVSISELSAAGLPIASVVRASKVAVIEDQDILKRVGTHHTADRTLFTGQLREYLVGD
jgi:mRNA-degrading endonuclease toxin of MazEF toxin-antitoxin module